MQHSFSYSKPKTIQALRFHFLARNEIKILMVVVNIFAIVSAALFYTKKIRPEPFLLGTFIWVLLMIAVWYILPYSIYKRAGTFREDFTIHLHNTEIVLQNEKGMVEWPFTIFSKWFETPHFFHLYFDNKSFFLIPKEGMSEEMQHELRGSLNKHILKK